MDTKKRNLGKRGGRYKEDVAGSDKRFFSFKPYWDKNDISIQRVCVLYMYVHLAARRPAGLDIFDEKNQIKMIERYSDREWKNLMVLMKRHRSRLEKMKIEELLLCFPSGHILWHLHCFYDYCNRYYKMTRRQDNLIRKIAHYFDLSSSDIDMLSADKYDEYNLDLFGVDIPDKINPMNAIEGSKEWGFRIFGISATSDRERIKRRYRYLLRWYHPDRSVIPVLTKKQQNDYIQKVNSARSILLS